MVRHCPYYSSSDERSENGVLKAKKSLSLSSRFSSGDLSSELDDEPTPNTGLASVGRQDSSQNYQGVAERPLQSQPQPMPTPTQPVPGAPPPGSDLSLNLRPSSRTTSAPSSPAKTRESLLQRVQSLTGAARDQEYGIDTKYIKEKMQQDNISEPTEQTIEKMMPVQPFLFANTREQNASYLESPCKTEYNEATSQTFSIPGNEELLPVRMTQGSVYYSPAFRLDESNVCAEALEAILFDSLEGELIFAEYQQNKFLSSTTQQKLTDVLLSRSAKSMTVAKHVQNYFVKLTNSIVKLMPNEDPSVYYIPPQSIGNESKNPKGKLPDKWRNLTYQLRIRGILPRKKLKDKTTSSADTSKTKTLKDEVDIHLKSLQVLREPLSQVILHWDATFDYRKLVRSSLNILDDVLIEWPILKTDIGPQLIESEFGKLFQYEGLLGKWISFFNTLYEIKKKSIRDSIGKEYCNIFESLKKESSDVLAGIQIQLLPYLIPPITKIKTGNGIIVKPTIWESSEGFVIYCKTSESITQKVEFRTDRYRNWNVPVQPCIVLQGPQPHDIKSAYVSLQQQIWELDSPLRALDLAFKFYQVFNLQYPVDCEQLWLVIQKIVYDITTPFDKKLTNVTSITNVLNLKLKCKKQRTN